MKAAGIEVFGVADYNETLPGTGFKQREMFDGIQSVIVCLIPWDTGMNEGRNMARTANKYLKTEFFIRIFKQKASSQTQI